MRVGDAVDLGVERLDPLDLRLQEIDRRSLAGLEQSDEVVDGSVAERIVGLGARRWSIERRRETAAPALFMSILRSIIVRLRAVWDQFDLPEVADTSPNASIVCWTGAEESLKVPENGSLSSTITNSALPIVIAPSPSAVTTVPLGGDTSP